MNIANHIDHTLLKPDATEHAVKALCEEAFEHGFAAVCVNPRHVALCVEKIGGYGIDTVVCSVIGFPLGATVPAVVAMEASVVIGMGAMEVDMVADICAIKQNEFAKVRDGIATVVLATLHANPHARVKVILESHLLSNRELVLSCEACKQAGAHFVKTCTGFSGGGATVEDVEIMRTVVGDQMGVKASGGIKDFQDAIRMIKAGANRIGASSGVIIVEGANQAA